MTAAPKPSEPGLTEIQRALDSIPNGPGSLRRGYEAVYAAGKAAAFEEAAKVCDAMHEREDDNCGEAAYAIRALAKP
jgi:hypothetical protein